MLFIQKVGTRQRRKRASEKEKCIIYNRDTQRALLFSFLHWRGKQPTGANKSGVEDRAVSKLATAVSIEHVEAIGQEG